MKFEKNCTPAQKFELLGIFFDLTTQTASVCSNNTPTVSEVTLVFVASSPISMIPVLTKSARGNVDMSASSGP